MTKRKKNKKRGRKPPQHVLIEAVSAAQHGTTESSGAEAGAEPLATAPEDSSAGPPRRSDEPPSAADPSTADEVEATVEEATHPNRPEADSAADQPDAEADKDQPDQDQLDADQLDADNAADQPDPIPDDGGDATEDNAEEDSASEDHPDAEGLDDSEQDEATTGAEADESIPDDGAGAREDPDEAAPANVEDAASEDADEDGSGARMADDVAMDEESSAAPDGTPEADGPGEEARADDHPTINLGADPFGTPDQIEEDTTANCLWCGAERPVEEAVCPSCQHAWIDATIAEARGGKLEAFSDQQPELPPRRPWWRRAWIPVVLAVAAAGVYAAVFWVMWDNTGPDEPAAATTQPTVPTTVTPTTAPPSTTAAPTTTTSSTSTTTTTTTTTSTLPPIAIVEPPYQPGDLTLGAFALGPISFGPTDADVLGRLAATFGQPTAQFPVGENWGLCPDDTARALEFGHLSIILRSEPSGEAVVGYRLRSETAGSGEDPSATLESISGLGLGDTLAVVQELYSVVATSELDDGTPIFLVLRSSDRRTLLWGELSAASDAEVLSINSPRPCDGGPFGQ